jgi:branched-chain amino acid aminotransferase
MNELTIYLDGNYRKINQDELRALSPGFLNGLGVFETLLCEKGKVYFLPEHDRRFRYGCDRYILPHPPKLGDIRKILAELSKVNNLVNARVRLAAWRKGYQTHCAVVAVPREAFSVNSYREGFSACIYSKVLDRSAELAKIKSLDYGFFLDAYEYALHHDCHEAVLLSSSGVIVEGSRSNIFLVNKKKLMTPSLLSGCLAGVTRQAVLSVAKKAGVKAAAAELPLKDLHQCEEAFLTNSLIGIMPLTALGDQKIGSGRPGPLTVRLMKGYEKLRQSSCEFLV